MTEILLLLILVVLCVIAVGLWRLSDEANRLTANVNQLRMSGRTVQKTAIMRDGELTEERSLTRLSRATKGRRIVVGGDEDSPLHQDLIRGMSRDDDDE